MLADISYPAASRDAETTSKCEYGPAALSRGGVPLCLTIGVVDALF